MFGFSFNKKEVKAVTKIVSANLEETVINDLAPAPSGSDDPRSASASQESTCDTLNSDQKTSPNAEEVLAELQAAHLPLADEACDKVRDLCISSEGWQLWEAKHGVLTEKCDLPDRTVGRATFEWTNDEYQMDAVENFLWDDKAKAQYDEFSEAMLLMVQYEGDYHVVDQVFKSRFGIAGRDFLVVVHKRREDTDSHEVLIIGVQSVPPEDESRIENMMAEDVAARYWPLRKKVVRGVAFAAGYRVERDRSNNKYRLTYVNDADVKSRGVPQWIVLRVKLDQLKIIRNIPPCVDKAVAEKALADQAITAPSDMGTSSTPEEVVDARAE